MTRIAVAFSATIFPSFLFLLFFSNPLWAAHPLTTDDTGTQGEGRFQWEMTYERGLRDENFSDKHHRQLAVTLAYGARDNLDLILAVPYQRLRTETGTGIETHSGRGDIGIEAKWRFFEHETLSMALKPGVTLPTGDENIGLGSGKSGFQLTHVVTRETDPWAWHAQWGYRRHRNTTDERRDIWQASVGGWRAVNSNLRVVGDVGVETNTDKTASTHPAFLILGFIYSVTRDFDFDLAIKKGLNRPETEYSFLGGLTIRF